MGQKIPTRRRATPANLEQRLAEIEAELRAMSRGDVDAGTCRWLMEEKAELRAERNRLFAATGRWS